MHGSRGSRGGKERRATVVAALESLVVERRYYLAGHRKMGWLPNLTAEVAVFLVRRSDR